VKKCYAVRHGALPEGKRQFIDIIRIDTIAGWGIKVKRRMNTACDIAPPAVSACVSICCKIRTSLCIRQLSRGSQIIDIGEYDS
jgi:hypothetical protein